MEDGKRGGVVHVGGRRTRNQEEVGKVRREVYTRGTPEVA